MSAPSPMDPAPSPWKVIDDYGKTVITLASALLALTVTFLGQLKVDEASSFQVCLLIGMWVFLLLTILFGLLSAAMLSEYLRGTKGHKPCVFTSNAAFFTLLLAGAAFALFATVRVLGPPSKHDPKTVIRKALEFMPSFDKTANGNWAVQSMTFDSTKKSYQLVLQEETTKTLFSLTVPITADSIDAKRLP